VSWIGKLFAKDQGREDRIRRARQQADDAKTELAEARELGESLRRHEAANHFGDRIAAAFKADDRRGRHA
jgi:hypothetical protein